MLLLGIVIGLIIGVITTLIFKPRIKSSGVFIIDSTNPDEEFPRLEFYENLNSMYNKKRIMLDIKTSTYSPK